jgi:glycosyltransferase involved in cell wall biosynthesis
MVEFSIVMAYFNRKELIKNTLKSIEKSKYKKYIEIIIVDDASEDNQRLEDLDFDLNIKLIRIEKKDKTWINPSVPYNIGFKNATGNKIIIQNPECFHVGDIIESVMKNLIDGIYLSYGCYSINKNSLNILKNTLLNKNWTSKNINDNIQLKNKAVSFDGDDGWYNHIKYKPSYLHFCSAITKNDLEKIGGFDERFANGIAFEDNEFLYRVKKKLEIKFVSGPFVIHQYHNSTDYTKRELVIKNQQILQKLMK